MFKWLALAALVFSVASVSGTVIAAKCASGAGVVLGSDSLDAQGPLVDNRFSEKVVRINPLTVLCAAAYNADVRNLCSELRRVCVMHRADCDEVLGVDSVAHVARRLVHAQFPEAHVVVVGCNNDDDSAAQPPKFGIHEILPGGTRIEQDIAVAGSGSKLIVSLINELWADGPASAVADASTTAAKLKRALLAAMRSDPGSGGEVALWSLSLRQDAKSSTRRRVALAKVS